MKADWIKKVLIVGSGTMGREIGFHCASNGFDVTMYDVSVKSLEGAKAGIPHLADIYVKMNRLSQDDVEKALCRISFTTDVKEAAKDADLVSESVPENPSLKEKVFSQLHEVCPERTIFSSNTSSLMASQFAKNCGRPDRLIAFHFYELRVSLIVDVMPHTGTSTEVTETMMDFARRIKLLPILLQKEHPGYLFNNILMAILGSALSLAEKKVAPIQDIDRSWIGVLRHPVGPFGIMDGIGLDTVFDINNFWATVTKDKQLTANAAYVKEFVDQGKLGTKTKEGFYKYPNPEYQQPDFMKVK